jgi:DNA mismatch repair protein MutL
MKHQIRPLDVQLINQIAAGEVIEGPFSAVKELVENAIDARATDIRVEIRQGGKELIAVTDNGMGIPGDQIETAFMPHTTSKLSTIDDLQHIHTLGFRGEALASIAAVARIEVQTRAEDSLEGYRAVFENGALQVLEETGCPAGTRIIIRDLFYQTPARLKFMKSDGAEASRITELITRLILSRPDIAFQYINNNNIMLTTRRQTDPLQTAMTVFPHELAKGLFIAAEKTYSKGDHSLRISGLMGSHRQTGGTVITRSFLSTDAV